MRDGSHAAQGLLLGLGKWVLTIAGVVIAIVGLATGNGSFIGVGVGAFVLGQVVHWLDQQHMDIQLKRWATEAVAGVGPVPPQGVRKHLAQLAWGAEGMGGDVKAGFQQACQGWATEQTAGKAGDQSHWPE